MIIIIEIIRIRRGLDEKIYIGIFTGDDIYNSILCRCREDN